MDLVLMYAIICRANNCKKDSKYNKRHFHLVTKGWKVSVLPLKCHIILLSERKSCSFDTNVLHQSDNKHNKENVDANPASVSHECLKQVQLNLWTLRDNFHERHLVSPQHKHKNLFPPVRGHRVMVLVTQTLAKGYTLGTRGVCFKKTVQILTNKWHYDRTSLPTMSARATCQLWRVDCFRILQFRDIYRLR